MAKAKRKRNRGGVAKPVNDNQIEGKLKPTAERERKNVFRSMGMANRLVPVIFRLHEAGVLNDREFEALAYYRDQASLADKSPTRSCIDFSPRGGHGPGVAIMSASLETGRMERDMGPLWSLCRAVAVDDVTLERWCIERYGSLNTAGPLVADPQQVGIATLELKYAAGGIVVGRAA